MLCTKVDSIIWKYGQQVCPFWSPHTNTLGSLETLISKQRIDFGSYHANHENKQSGPKVVVGSEIWSFLSYTPSFFILCNGKKRVDKSSIYVVPNFMACTTCNIAKRDLGN